MTGGPRQELSRNVNQALGALQRLLYKHEAITPDQALKAMESLLKDTDVEPSLDLIQPRKKAPEKAGDGEGERATGADSDANNDGGADGDGAGDEATTGRDGEAANGDGAAGEAEPVAPAQG